MEELRLSDLRRKSARDIIKRPIISEKSVENASMNKYTFEVDRNANKIEIRKAVEEVFRVKVTKVTTSNFKGKRRVRFDKKGRHEGYASDWKKAVVSLKEGDKIELAGVNPFEM